MISLYDLVNLSIPYLTQCAYLLRNMKNCANLLIKLQVSKKEDKPKNNRLNKTKSLIKSLQKND